MQSLLPLFDMQTNFFVKAIDGIMVYLTRMHTIV